MSDSPRVLRTQYQRQMPNTTRTPVLENEEYITDFLIELEMILERISVVDLSKIIDTNISDDVVVRALTETPFQTVVNYEKNISIPATQ
jgi:hypothetical protein